MKRHFSTLTAVALALLLAPVLAERATSEGEAAQAKEHYENYSFDFSAHERPIAYTTIGNALELVNKVKVNPAVGDRGGAYVLDELIRDKDFEVEVEFTLQGDLDSSRGFMILLTQEEMLEQNFLTSTLGYRQDYEGFAVFVFRHPHRENKWFVMTLQNMGSRGVLRLENQIYSGLRNLNHCEIDMEAGKRSGVRNAYADKMIVTTVKVSDDVSYRSCSKQGFMNKNWKQHYFAIAAKNTLNDQGEMMITDLDVDSIQIRSLRPWEMPSAEQ